MGKHDINAFLGAGTSFSGRLAFCGVVRIDGEFEGEIVSAGSLVVGENARVSGRVAVGRLVCGGQVSAEVTATAAGDGAGQGLSGRSGAHPVAGGGRGRPHRRRGVHERGVASGGRPGRPGGRQ